MSVPGGSVFSGIVDSAVQTFFHPSSTASSTFSTVTTQTSSTTTASSSASASASASSSVSAPSLAISMSFAASAPTSTGVAANSYSSSTICDTNCIIAISTVLGGVFLLLSLGGIGYFIYRRRQTQAAAVAAAGRNWPLPAKAPASDRSEGSEMASTTLAGTDSYMEPQIGIVRRATDLANAVKDKLPGRSGTERGRPERVDYERAPSRSVSRAEDAGRPSRGLGWAI